MIDLHAWPTPNAHKVSIMLEETGLAYRVIAVDINQGAQFAPEFLAISPNNRIPAIVDHDTQDGAPLSVFESGAILLYLAEKTGRFLPREPRPRAAVLEWLMWQMGGLGPMCGQAHHFRGMAAVEVPYAIERYTKEVGRLYGVMDRRLADAPYLASAYSIADMASWPWVRLWKRQGVALADFPSLARWFEAIRERPAVARGMMLLDDKRRIGRITDAAREVLFGATQFTRR
ncbi:MAG: glutathione S-transferase family protein [Alphaproteobacteria bacterium]|nr:glutathione S-transferase family protein [Alphaproteobacteria bacterium]